ncbi:hypothetical protein WJ95_09480 [Burkholderia ubonensis]|nr:hypothetical protein WJ95_09480 [Burkholderia ubonensis]
MGSVWVVWWVPFRFWATTLFPVLPVRFRLCGRFFDFAFAALLDPHAVDELKEFLEHDAKRLKLILRACADQSCCLGLREA